MMANHMHGGFFLRSLPDSDVNRLAILGPHGARFSVAEVFTPGCGAHVALCGPGTDYPDWDRRDIYLMLAIGDWKPGHPGFERTLALMRYDALLRAGKSGFPHSIRVMHLGTPEHVAQMAKTELDLRESLREVWESSAA